MNFTDLITKHYKDIKYQVTYYAFKYIIDSSDLLSKVNESISVTILNDTVHFEHINFFWGYIHRLISSCAHKIRKDSLLLDSLDSYDAQEPFLADTKMSASILINNVLRSIKRDDHRAVFIAVMIDGDKYVDVSKRMGIHINYVKTIIHTTRTMAVKKYNQHYLDIMS